MAAGYARSSTNTEELSAAGKSCTQLRPRLELRDETAGGSHEALWVRLEALLGRQERTLLQVLETAMDRQEALLRGGAPRGVPEASPILAEGRSSAPRPLSRSHSSPGLLENTRQSSPGLLENTTKDASLRRPSYTSSCSRPSTLAAAAQPAVLLGADVRLGSPSASPGEEGEASPSSRRTSEGNGKPSGRRTSHSNWNYRRHQRKLAMAAEKCEESLRQEISAQVSPGSEPCQESLGGKANTFTMESWVRSPRFESFFSVLIFANMALFGIEVQHTATHRLDDPSFAFWLLGQLFNVAFLAELALRLCGQGRSFLDRQNRWWNALDTLLVFVSIIEVALQKHGTLKFLRAIRVAKMVRLFRLVRLLRFFRSLRLLIYSIANTLRALCWTMLLLAIIMYVFGILFTQATTHYLILHASTSSQAKVEGMDVFVYYGTLWRSCYTLFMSIAGGVSWESVVEPLSAVGWEWVALFLIYISFTYFAVLNVVTGVFCQTAIESATQDATAVLHAQQAAKASFVDRLTNLFALIDADNLGKITLGSFHRSLADERVQSFFLSMDISVSDAWEFFKLLDRDGTHTIDIGEFVDGCLHLKGAAGKIDVASLRYEVHWMMEGFQELLAHTHGRPLRPRQASISDW